jgi:ADP-dependent phosphofructokinase/glucokinase
MQYSELKKKWLNHYQTAAEQLEKMTEVKGLISAFNANIDAVIKISGKQIEQIIKKHSLNRDRLLIESDKSINTNEDAVRGLIHCFKNGIAEEWLIESKKVFNWLNKNIGYDKMQMGGQGGIVANVMAVCGVDPVYVHTASSPKEQSKLFLDLPNLKNVDENGKIRKAHDISRNNDIPLIHWIIEFDKGDTININNKTINCPKANRFIATYDPLNFKLHIDEAFNEKMSGVSTEYEYIILSGYQMLQNQLPGGDSGIERIEESKKIVQQWRENNSQHILHFEIASTQDKTIRKHLINSLAKEVDSLGFNERELIDILEVTGETELAEQCEENTSSSNLFMAMLKVFSYTTCPRIQLHMFGLYITIQKRGYKVSPIQNRKGMQLAANIAASKAGTGSIDSKDVLLWSKDQFVSEIGLKELKSLSETVEEEFGINNIFEEGIFVNDEIEIIAVPTIIIENPVTLVGMGDTISSVSLVAAR